MTLTIPMTGWIARSVTAINSQLFNRLTLPRIAPESEAWEAALFAVYTIQAEFLLPGVLLHCAIPLHRHFARKGRDLGSDETGLTGAAWPLQASAGCCLAAPCAY